MAYSATRGGSVDHEGAQGDTDNNQQVGRQ
jgi:hypothetical protein